MADEAEPKPVAAKTDAASPPVPEDEPPTSKKPEPEGLPKQAWGAPLVRLDAKWTRFEARLCAWVLIADILALVTWVTLSGLSAEGTVAGVVFRSMVGATVLGLLANRLTRGKEPKVNTLAVTGAVLLGLATGKVWEHVGVTYISNFLNWIQNASVFMLVGGLRSPGLATRLTLWLALLGASIATAQGKNINVDVLMRFLTPKMRVPVAIIGWAAAAAVCITGAWGFFDHIAIQEFKIPVGRPCPEDSNKMCETTPGEKIALVRHHMGSDVFLVGRQLSLDVRTLPKVLSGTRYSDWLTAPQWNEWMKGAAWTDHFPAEDVQAQMMPEDLPKATRLPAVNVPSGSESARGLLTRDLNFIFPFGLFIIALRFILRGLLVLSGHVTVDPDAAHGEEEVKEIHDGASLKGDA